MSLHVLEKLRNLLRPNAVVPHVCWTCKWFQARKKGGNKYCLYPGKIRVTENYPHRCLCWMQGSKEQIMKGPHIVDM